MSFNYCDLSQTYIALRLGKGNDGFRLITFKQWRQGLLRYLKNNQGSIVVLVFFAGELAFAGNIIWNNIENSLNSVSSIVNEKSDQIKGSNSLQPIVTNRSTFKNIEISANHALFYSQRSNTHSTFRVTIVPRKNANDDTVYDIAWSDGVQTVFVFWDNGHAEIITKQKNGNSVVDQAQYQTNSQGQTIVTSNSGSYSVFPGFDPQSNSDK